MPDIDLYTQSPELYDTLQEMRPDYVDAVDVSSTLAAKYTAGGDVRLLDLCCGTGTATCRFSQRHPLAEVELVDINPDFLRVAKSKGIVTQELTVIDKDVRRYQAHRDFNVVFSIFAYHHMPDPDKEAYIDTIVRSLLPNGLLFLAEIFFQDKASEKAYYRELLEAIPENEHWDELESFLEQTAQSTDFEFKVPKGVADDQFRRNGFHLVEERKIWPNTQDKDGAYVQVYRYGANKS
jgi:trans-aconitate methyltransferase